jgi:hypothetical protein
MIRREDHPAKTIIHESGHAVGLLVNHHGVAEVRVDHDVPGELGLTTADFSHSQADYGYLIAGLMGPMNAGDPPPPWPPDRDSNDTDERNAAVLVEHLELSRSDYLGACAIAEFLLDWHECKGAMALLGQALHRVPVITGEQLEELLGPRRLARLRREDR